MTKQKVDDGTYTGSQIQVLEGLEPVRKRPGMYIGSTGYDGLHHLIKEIADNSIDEAIAGYATKVSVTILADGGVRVEDDGRGIPIDKHEKTGKSSLETVLTILHAGGKFGGGGYKVSSGLHGVGSSVVNALSTHLLLRSSKTVICIGLTSSVALLRVSCKKLAKISAVTVQSLRSIQTPLFLKRVSRLTTSG